jgi:hypothetical protein
LGKPADTPFPGTAPAIILFGRVGSGRLLSGDGIEPSCSSALSPTGGSPFAFAFFFAGSSRVEQVAFATLSKFSPTHFLGADPLCKGILTTGGFSGIENVAVKVGFLHVFKH